MLLEVGDVVRLDTSNDHRRETVLAILLCDQGPQEELIFGHNMGTVTSLGVKKITVFRFYNNFIVTILQQFPIGVDNNGDPV